MPVVSVDQDILNEIMRVRYLIKGSIDGVMDGTLTAGHLASDVQMLLELLDKLQSSSAAPQPTPTPVEQPAQPAPPPEQPQPAQPQPEQAGQEVPVTVEASPVEQQ